jgi:hypothetical protein
MAGRQTTDKASTARRWRAALGVGAVLAGGALALSASSAGAVEWGNPSFLGVLRGSPPAGFPVSPAALDLSSGPVTIHVSVTVANLTRAARSMPIQLSVHRILTYRGQDVRDGQPGQPGLSFPVGAAAQTTQSLALPRTTKPLSVPAGRGSRAAITFPATLSDCGYYQIDFSTPAPPYSFLASGFTRALGCGAAPATTTTNPVTTTIASPTTSTTVAPQPMTVSTLSPAATTTSVEGVTVTHPGTLPVTGTSPILPLVSLLCFATGGALLFAALRHSPR